MTTTADKKKALTTQLESQQSNQRKGFVGETGAIFKRLAVTTRRDPFLTKARIGQTIFSPYPERIQTRS